MGYFGLIFLVGRLCVDLVCVCTFWMGFGRRPSSIHAMVATYIVDCSVCLWHVGLPHGKLSEILHQEKQECSYLGSTAEIYWWQTVGISVLALVFILTS